MLQDEVGSVIGAERATASHDSAVPIVLVVLDERDHLVDDESLVVVRASGLVGGMAFGEPSLPVASIDTEDLQSAFVDEALEGLNHASVLELVVLAPRAGEYQKGTAVMTVHFNLEIFVESRAPPLVIFDLHH